MMSYLYHQVQFQCMAQKIFFGLYHLIFTTCEWGETPPIALCISSKNHRHLRIRYVEPHDTVCFLPGTVSIK